MSKTQNAVPATKERSIFTAIYHLVGSIHNVCETIDNGTGHLKVVIDTAGEAAEGAALLAKEKVRADLSRQLSANSKL